MSRKITQDQIDEMRQRVQARLKEIRAEGKRRAEENREKRMKAEADRLATGEPPVAPLAAPPRTSASDNELVESGLETRGQRHARIMADPECWDGPISN